MAGNKNKEYGLILKKPGGAKPGQGPKKVAAIFNEGSSDDDEETSAVVTGGIDWMKKKLSSGKKNAKSGATGTGTKIKAQTKMALAKAVEEDPTVFQYDEVYDDMEKAKVEKTKEAKEKDRKPRYITNLLKHAEVRQKEYERRVERQVQKEREAEGDQFADKEKFVTSAYRKKMEEMEKLEEEERKRDAIESVLDVTKQKDMSGFYRHIYRQTMGEEKGQSSKVKDEPEEEQDQEAADSPVEKDSVDVKDEKIHKRKIPNKRTYRRKSEGEGKGQSDSSDASDASDNEGDEKNSDEEAEKAQAEEQKKKADKEQKRKEELRRQKIKRDRRKRRIEEGRDTSSEEESDPGSDHEADDSEKNSDDEAKSGDKENQAKNSDGKTSAPKAKKPKRDIWAKVTVGSVFEDAVKRYLIRKSERSAFP